MIDYIKVFKEWKDEYLKNNEKDLYIHRLEDLNDKLCKENEQLKKEIDILRGRQIKIDENHMKILELFLKDKKIKEQDVLKFIGDDLDLKLSLAELIDYDYLVKIKGHDFMDGFSSLYSWNDGIEFDILKSIKEYKETTSK